MSTVNLDSLQVSPFSFERDIPRLLTLYTQVEAADREGREVNESELRAQVEAPGHDPLHDRWVIDNPENKDELIACALVQLDHENNDAYANIIVHPQWRQLGIGEMLLQKATQRSRELNAATMQIFVNAQNTAAATFVHKHGFTPQGAYTELRLPASTRLPPIIWPFGYTMRTYSEVQDIAILTEAMNLSYIPLWGHHEVSQEQMSSWLPSFIPEGIFLVFSEKGRVVGISRTEPSPGRTAKNAVPTGYIDAPGVVPQHRRLDLYRALVLTGIRWLQQQGQAIIEMESWGDKLEVLKMYRELGFKDIRQHVCYQRKLLEDQPDVPSSP